MEQVIFLKAKIHLMFLFKILIFRSKIRNSFANLGQEVCQYVTLTTDLLVGTIKHIISAYDELFTQLK